MVSSRETGVTYLLSSVLRLSRTFIINVYNRFNFFLLKTRLQTFLIYFSTFIRAYIYDYSNYFRATALISKLFSYNVDLSPLKVSQTFVCLLHIWIDSEG